MLGSLLKQPAGVKSAKDFLAKVVSAKGPWEIVYGNRARQITAGADKTLGDFISEANGAKLTCSVVLPLVNGLVSHIVVQAPKGASNRKLEIDPSWLVTTQDDYLIWLLSSPIPAPEAQAIGKRFAKAVGGEPIVGKAIPLPGTMAYKVIKAGLADKRSVGCMAVSRMAYRLADGRLARPASASKPALDPSALNVPIGDSDSGPVIWTPGQLANGYLLTLGGSGAGKTFALRQLAASIHRYGVPVLIFDFHGDVQVPGIRDELLSSGTDSVRGLNPMELDGACARQSGLYDQRGSLQEMITRACPMLGHRQRNALIEAMEKVYVQAGILDNDPATWGNPPPTFADLMGVIDDDGLKAATRTLFGHPIFRRSEHIAVDGLLAGSVRLDLSKLSDEVRFIATETLLQRIFRMLRMRGSIPIKPTDDRERFRLFVVIDEVQILSLGGGVNVLDTLFREARKFGLGMILGTQSASNLTKDVRANASAWLTLLHNEMDEAKKTAPNIGVEPDALMKLKGKGDGYYRAGTEAARRVQVRAG